MLDIILSVLSVYLYNVRFYYFTFSMVFYGGLVFCCPFGCGVLWVSLHGAGSVPGGQCMAQGAALSAGASCGSGYARVRSGLCGGALWLFFFYALCEGSFCVHEFLIL